MFFVIERFLSLTSVIYIIVNFIIKKKKKSKKRYKKTFDKVKYFIFLKKVKIKL